MNNIETESERGNKTGEKRKEENEIGRGKIDGE